MDSFVASTSTGHENEPLKLDGILFLGKCQFLQHRELDNSITGGARRGMFGHLPHGILSQQGYKGCLATLELAGQAVSPLQEAVVPSDQVVHGCQGKFSPALTLHQLETPGWGTTGNLKRWPELKEIRSYLTEKGNYSLFFLSAHVPLFYGSILAFCNITPALFHLKVTLII